MTTLNKRYQEILNQSFRNHVAGWDSLSPLDPMKMIAEGIGSSLSAIEGRQSRLIDTILNSLPSLLHFQLKPALAPAGFFRVEPTATLSEVIALDADLLLPLQKETETLSLQPSAQARIYPFTNLVCKYDNHQIEMRFLVRGQIGEIPVHFIPTEALSANSLMEASLTVADLKGNHLTRFDKRQLEVTDHTQGLATAGTLVVRPGRGAGLHFSESNAEYTLTLTFAEIPPQDSFFLNVISAEIVDIVPEYAIGELQGEAWEEIRLDDSILAPPSEVRITYPDRTVLTLERVESDILLSRVENPSRFLQSFFYHAANHSLIFPGAHLLMSDFNGGVKLEACHVTRLPKSEWPGEGFQFSNNPSPSTIAELHPLALTHRIEPRESRTDYLKRFYSAFRLFTSSQTASSGVYPEEIRSQVLSAEPEVRSAEVKVDTAHKVVTVFAKSSALGQGELGVTPEVAERVGEKLNKIVPLDYQWEISPFVAKPVRVIASLSAEIGTRRMAQVSELTVKERVQGALQTLFSTEYFSKERSHTRKDLTARLQHLLVSPDEAGATLLPEEVTGLELMIVNEATGTFLDTLSRRAGELISPDLQIKVDLQRAKAESAVTTSSRVSTRKVTSTRTERRV